MSDTVLSNEMVNPPRWIGFLRISLTVLYVLAIPSLVISFYVDKWYPVLALLFAIGPLSLILSSTYLITWLATRNRYRYKRRIVETSSVTVLALAVNTVFLYILAVFMSGPVFD